MRETGRVWSEGYQDLQHPDRLFVLGAESTTVGAHVEMTEQPAPLDPVERGHCRSRNVITEFSTLRRRHYELGMVHVGRLPAATPSPGLRFPAADRGSPLTARQWIEQCFVGL